MTWLLSELNSDWEFLFSVQFHLPAFVSLPRSVSLHSADTATAAAGSSPKAVDALLASPALLSYSKTTTEAERCEYPHSKDQESIHWVLLLQIQ